MKKKLYTKEDIETAITFLKTNQPEVPANREEALKLLEGMQSFSEAFVATVGKKKKKNAN